MIIITSFLIWAIKEEGSEKKVIYFIRKGPKKVNIGSYIDVVEVLNGTNLDEGENSNVT